MTLSDDDILTMQLHEAEDTILGVALIYANAANELSGIVKPSDFYRKTEGRVFEILIRLNENCVVNRESVWLEMKAAGIADDDHDIGWLFSLSNNVGTYDSALYYAHNLKKLSIKVRLAKHWERQAYDAQDPTTTIEDLIELDEVVTKQLSRSSAPDLITSPAGNLLVQYLQRINAGELQQLTKQYSALAGIEIGPGLVTVIGAPPGFGKTALSMQVMFDAIELEPDLQVVVANAETTFDGLLRRELTRITRIKSDDIRFGNLSARDLEEINKAASELIPRMQRVRVLNDPHTLDQLLRLKDDPPAMLIVDYLQKFAPPDKDARQGVGDVMAGLRSLAKVGWTIVCLSATARTKDGKHDSKSLNLSSFRESGEIEYNADSAYLLLDNGPIAEQKPYIRHVTLQHVKNRHGAKRDHELMFHMPAMSFDAMPEREVVGEEFAFGGAA